MLRSVRVSVSVAVVLGMLVALPAGAEETPGRIAVSGQSEIQLVPDIATISVGVQVQEDTAVAAMAGASSMLQGVFAALDELAIAAEDRRTDSFSLETVYSRDDMNNPQQRPPAVIGYRVSNMVQITVRDVDSLGAAVDRLALAGANNINNISFSVSDPEAHMDDLRADAVRDARHRAEIYAEAAGVTLGRVISLSDGSNVGRPAPMYARMEMAADMPMAAGTVPLGSSVEMVFEIE